MIRLILTLLLCQADADAIRARIAIELALQQQAAQERIAVAPQPTYADIYTEATEKQLPLVVGVGVDAPKGVDWLTWRQERPWHKWTQPSVVVSVPDGDTLYHVKTLPASATWDDVFDALAEWQGKRIIERRRSTEPQKKWSPERVPNFQDRMNRQQRYERGGASLSVGRATTC